MFKVRRVPIQQKSSKYGTAISGPCFKSSKGWGVVLNQYNLMSPCDEAIAFGEGPCHDIQHNKLYHKRESWDTVRESLFKSKEPMVNYKSSFCTPSTCKIRRKSATKSNVHEFIIQHENTTSIAETLGLLKDRWDAEGIKVTNFWLIANSLRKIQYMVCSRKVPYICVGPTDYRLGCNGLSILRMEWLATKINFWVCCSTLPKPWQKRNTQLLSWGCRSHASVVQTCKIKKLQQWYPKKLVRNLVYVNMKFWVVYLKLLQQMPSFLPLWLIHIVNMFPSTCTKDHTGLFSIALREL